MCKNVNIVIPAKSNGQYRFLDRSDVEKKFNVPVDKWGIYLAVGGDCSDNIKPQKGLGPKTAAKLVEAGIDPSLDYDSQPDFVKSKIPSETWERVQQCYQVARLPKDCDDLPEPYNKTVRSPGVPMMPSSVVKDPETNLLKFAAFCADNGMTELFGCRNEFFN